MTEKWAYLLEDDREFAKLVPLRNLPYIWVGPTAEFNVDPRTVKDLDCWWEIISVSRDYHYKFALRRKWEHVRVSGQSVFSDSMLFFADHDEMRRYWQESGITPIDVAVLYQDWGIANDLEMMKQRNR